MAKRKEQVIRTVAPEHPTLSQREIEAELAELPANVADSIRQAGKHAEHAVRVFQVLRELPLEDRWTVLELCLDASTQWPARKHGRQE